MKRWVCAVSAASWVVVSAAWAVDGAAVYKEKCAKCHGETGASDTAMGKSMKVQPIAGDAELAAKSIDEIVAAIKESKKHKRPVTSLPDDELKASAAVVKELAGK